MHIFEPTVWVYLIFIYLFVGVCLFLCCFSMIFRYQLGLHDKPIGVLNVANYWGSLIEWVCEKDSSLNQIQGATKVLSDSPGLVELLAGLVFSYHSFPDGQAPLFPLFWWEIELLYQKVSSRKLMRENDIIMRPNYGSVTMSCAAF